MENLILREMHEEDVVSAVVVCKKCFGKQVFARKSYLENAAWSWRYEALVAELDGKIVACMTARIAERFENYSEAKRDFAEIEVVAVDPNYHGQGIGTKLFGKLIAMLEENDIELMYLIVHPSNMPAINFFEHFGFKYFGNSGLMTRKPCQDN